MPTDKASNTPPSLPIRGWNAPPPDWAPSKITSEPAPSAPPPPADAGPAPAAAGDDGHPVVDWALKAVGGVLGFFALGFAAGGAWVLVRTGWRLALRVGQWLP